MVNDNPKAEKGLRSKIKSEKGKLFSGTSTNAVVDPYTMVVHHVHTFVTGSTVMNVLNFDSFAFGFATNRIQLFVFECSSAPS